MAKTIPLNKLYSTKKSLHQVPNETKGYDIKRARQEQDPSELSSKTPVKVQKRKAGGVKKAVSEADQKEAPATSGIQLQATIFVNQPPEVCYRYWRDFENLPHFMKHLQAVEVIDDTHSHWVVDAPADTTVEWDAEIIEDVPDESISWRSTPDAQIANAGSVHFTSPRSGRQTIVKVALTYNPPLGAIGEAIIELFSESPDEKLADDLARFKNVIENEEMLP